MAVGIKFGRRLEGLFFRVFPHFPCRFGPTDELVIRRIPKCEENWFFFFFVCSRLGGSLELGLEGWSDLTGIPRLNGALPEIPGHPKVAGQESLGWRPLLPSASVRRSSRTRLSQNRSRHGGFPYKSVGTFRAENPKHENSERESRKHEIMKGRKRRSLFDLSLFRVFVFLFVFEFRISCFEFRISSLFRISGFGFRISISDGLNEESRHVILHSLVEMD